MGRWFFVLVTPSVRISRETRAGIDQLGMFSSNERLLLNLLTSLVRNASTGLHLMRDGNYGKLPIGIACRYHPKPFGPCGNGVRPLVLILAYDWF